MGQCRPWSCPLAKVTQTGRHEHQPLHPCLPHTKEVTGMTSHRVLERTFIHAPNNT